MNKSPAERRSPLGLLPGHRAPRPGRSSQPARWAVKSKGVMLIRIRRRDYRYHEAQVAEPEGFVAVGCADSTTHYKGQNLGFRILCGSI
jgi:hypothetical protein